MFSKIVSTIEQRLWNFERIVDTMLGQVTTLINIIWAVFFGGFALIGFGVMVLNTLHGVLGRETTVIEFVSPPRSDAWLILFFFVFWFAWTVRLAWLRWKNRHDR